MKSLFEKYKYFAYCIFLLIINLISFDYSESINNFRISPHLLYNELLLNFINVSNSLNFEIVFIVLISTIYFFMVKDIKNIMLKWILIILSILLSLPILNLVGSGSNSL
jgi:hypothetical protein